MVSRQPLRVEPPNRLSMENGEVQLIRACREPTEIATRQALIRVAQELADEIQDGDEIAYFDEFKNDLVSIKREPKRHLEAGDTGGTEW